MAKNLSPKLSSKKAAPLISSDPKQAKPPKRKRISQNLAKTFERALQISPEAVKEYQPTEADLGILESMLSGAVNQVEIVNFTGLSPEVVKGVLRDNFACAWLSFNLHTLIRTRLGLVDAAVMNRALHGDISAAKLLYQRYNEMIERHVHLTQRMDFDPTHLSDEELQQLLRNKQNANAIDVEFKAEDTDHN